MHSGLYTTLDQTRKEGAAFDPDKSGLAVLDGELTARTNWCKGPGSTGLRARSENRRNRSFVHPAAIGFRNGAGDIDQTQLYFVEELM